MDELANISFFDAGDNCKMEEVKPVCHKAEQPVLDSKPCCQDHTLSVEAQEEITSASISKVPVAQLVIIAAVLVPELLLTESSAVVSSHLYSPPILVQDIPIIHEQFLI
ncbi:hypothetical protein GCM10011506_18700 [Marivirga lumbricoides]|uniref:Uncharacterized protein n=2 Tax=Marivirga lumbricoides TaxID=1046115 RepID=A0ABQ1M4D7_9BACT|nr:hypothetical protein GCM10011506_18700 [Marivirga lumbricoides]